MREPAGILIALGAALVAAACANQPAAKGAVSVEQVVEMSRSGASASTIIAKMQQTRSVYLLPGAGVASDEVRSPARYLPHSCHQGLDLLTPPLSHGLLGKLVVSTRSASSRRSSMPIRPYASAMTASASSVAGASG